jgi:hypothetical protein
MRVLPARLARLPRDFAIVFVRKSFLATTAAATATAGTTAPTAAAISATAATTGTARTAGFRFRAGFIHFQISSAYIFSVERRDGLGSFGVVGHFHETEAASATGFTIRGDVHARELTEGLEQSAEIFRGRLKAHIADKEIFHSDSPLSKPQPSLRQNTA